MQILTAILVNKIPLVRALTVTLGNSIPRFIHFFIAAAMLLACYRCTLWAMPSNLRFKEQPKYKITF